jgi:hypothetical protein
VAVPQSDVKVPEQRQHGLREIAGTDEKNPVFWSRRQESANEASIRGAADSVQMLGSNRFRIVDQSVHEWRETCDLGRLPTGAKREPRILELPEDIGFPGHGAAQPGRNLQE